ncbi:MAG: hypothetical protein MK188_00755 [Gammaproteobacteria bacterium]|nr:hypothetical protein [Gammaproteobacteria bacterium]
MNKLATSLLISLLATVLIGCSSGSSTTSPGDVVLNISGKFEGTFENTEGNQSGLATFDLQLAEDEMTVSGNALFDDENNQCLLSGPITGTLAGSNLTLSLDDFTFTLAVSSDANTLSGTYARSSNEDTRCGRTTGAGNITLTRS